MNIDAEPDRNEIIYKKFSAKMAAEAARTLGTLRGRADYLPSYNYFLDLAKDLTPEAAEVRAGRRIIRLMCIQAPLELVHAAGFHPFKVFCGSGAAGGLAVQDMPAIMCPLIRSVVGAAKLGRAGNQRPWILPATCDWVVKFPEILANAGAMDVAPVHWLELPHLKDGQRGRERWLDEIYGLKKFLETEGDKITRATLVKSVEAYRRAWRSFVKLENLRAEGLLPPVWFILMANTFFCDAPQNWSEAAEAAAADLQRARRAGPGGSLEIFLAGSPIFFPNFKLPFLLEEAGLRVTDDDLCSSGRIFPGAVTPDDNSEFGMMSALAQRYHQGCICPTFIDNDRRINNILASARRRPFRGVIFHVLKGCHPYDLESYGIEPKLKEHGLKFIRVETDYSAEDGGNLTTRLEAFRQTSGGG